MMMWWLVTSCQWFYFPKHNLQRTGNHITRQLLLKPQLLPVERQFYCPSMKIEFSNFIIIAVQSLREMIAFSTSKEVVLTTPPLWPIIINVMCLYSNPLNNGTRVTYSNRGWPTSSKVSIKVVANKNLDYLISHLLSI